MADTTTSSSPLKRQRDEQEQEQETKKQKPCSYDQVVCFLDEEEADNDLASLITTLQQEISTEVVENPSSSSSSSSCSFTSYSCGSKEEEYESEKEKEMKHLLEASDDELGIPNTTDLSGSNNYEMVKSETNQDYVNGFSLLDGFGDGFWELEDEAANYYTLLQSELFM